MPIAFDPALSERVIVVGPYRFVRHPFYVSYCLTFLAGALATVWWPAWLMAGLMWAAYVGVAVAEERHLLAGHPEAYGRYRARTGAFIPRAFGVGREASDSVR